MSGRYGYLVRLTKSTGASVGSVFLRTWIELNPRTLPELKAGHNELVYSAGAPLVRTPLPVAAVEAGKAAYHVAGARFVEQGGQGLLGAGRRRDGGVRVLPGVARQETAHELRRRGDGFSI